MAKILDHPTRQKAYLNGGVIQFRHPWIPEKILRFGVKKLPRVEHFEFQREAQSLLDRMPRTRREAPSRIRPILLDRYFRAIEETTRVPFLIIQPDGTIPQRDDLDTYLRDRSELFELRSEVKAIRGENQRLQVRIDELVKALNERTDAEKSATIRECWARFEERYQCRPGTKEEERRNVLRRVKCVLEHLGWDTPYCRIEKAHLLQAITDSGPRTEAERSKRTSNIKRFFRFLCLPTAEDGMSFTHNPAASLQYLGLQRLQRLRRNENGGVAIFPEPEKVLPLLDIYWRSLLGVLCYGGLRLAEAASLTWPRIDFVKRIITVKPSEIYPSLKSEVSERPVKPFRELWPILEDYHSQRLHDTWVFPRPSAPSQIWFKDLHGAPRISNLSSALSRTLMGAKIENVQEPARRARRYWETRMRSVGRTDLIEIMGGHSEKVGRDHYTDFLSVVERIEDNRF